jgi:probable addiction module antidote protein
MPKAAKKKAATTKTIPYDVAEQLRTPEEMAAYLDAWFEEAPDDAAGIARALGDIARAKGMTAVAKETGLSRESLYRALGPDGNPSFATVLKVAKAVGVRLRTEAADVGAMASRSTRGKIRYTDEPIGKIRVVSDFLPAGSGAGHAFSFKSSSVTKAISKRGK